jgi:hypothetical protein
MHTRYDAFAAYKGSEREGEREEGRKEARAARKGAARKISSLRRKSVCSPSNVCSRHLRTHSSANAERNDLRAYRRAGSDSSATGVDGWGTSGASVKTSKATREGGERRRSEGGEGETGSLRSGVYRRPGDERGMGRWCTTITTSSSKSDRVLCDRVKRNV